MKNAEPNPKYICDVQRVERIIASIAAEYRKRVMNPLDADVLIDELDNMIKNARLSGVNINGGRVKVLHEKQKYIAELEEKKNWRKGYSQGWTDGMEEDSNTKKEEVSHE